MRFLMQIQICIKDPFKSKGRIQNFLKIFNYSVFNKTLRRYKFRRKVYLVKLSFLYLPNLRKGGQKILIIVTR